MSVGQAVERGFHHGMFQHFDEVQSFAAWLISRGSLGPVLEIGAHRGGTSALFCELDADPVISVDVPDGPWGGIGVAQADIRDKELRRTYPAYTPVRGDSQEELTYASVIKILGERSLDVLFIDGDHSYLGVKHDYERYGPLVREGGVIAFHDIRDTQLHRDRGVMVSKLWRELKDRFESVEFSVNAEWGGIGAIIV